MDKFRLRQKLQEGETYEAYVSTGDGCPQDADSFRRADKEWQKNLQNGFVRVFTELLKTDSFRQRLKDAGIDVTDHLSQAAAPEPTLPIARIKESLSHLSNKERDELYHLLHDGYGCRMY